MLGATEPLRTPPQPPYPVSVSVARVVATQALVAFGGNFYSIGPGMSRATVNVRRRLDAAIIEVVTGFLKLTEAAEALPRVLDEARADKLSLVDDLEKLLAVEVTATEQRKLTSRLRFAFLPAPWRLADFDYSTQPGSRAKAR